LRLRGGAGLADVAGIGVGAALAVFGVAMLRGGGLFGVASIGVGAAAAVFGVALRRDGDELFGVASMGRAPPSSWAGWRCCETAAGWAASRPLGLALRSPCSG
jgi:hypothetical protein